MKEAEPQLLRFFLHTKMRNLTLFGYVIINVEMLIARQMFYTDIPISIFINLLQ